MAVNEPIILKLGDQYPGPRLGEGLVFQPGANSICDVLVSIARPGLEDLESLSGGVARFGFREHDGLLLTRFKFGPSLSYSGIYHAGLDRIAGGVIPLDLEGLRGSPGAHLLFRMVVVDAHDWRVVGLRAFTLPPGLTQALVGVIARQWVDGVGRREIAARSRLAMTHSDAWFDAKITLKRCGLIAEPDGSASSRLH